MLAYHVLSSIHTYNNTPEPTWTHMQHIITESWHLILAVVMYPYKVCQGTSCKSPTSSREASSSGSCWSIDHPARPEWRWLGNEVGGEKSRNPCKAGGLNLSKPVEAAFLLDLWLQEPFTSTLRAQPCIYWPCQFHDQMHRDNCLYWMPLLQAPTALQQRGTWDLGALKNHGGRVIHVQVGENSCTMWDLITHRSRHNFQSLSCLVYHVPSATSANRAGWRYMLPRLCHR